MFSYPTSSLLYAFHIATLYHFFLLLLKRFAGASFEEMTGALQHSTPSKNIQTADVLVSTGMQQIYHQCIIKMDAMIMFSVYCSCDTHLYVTNYPHLIFFRPLFPTAPMSKGHFHAVSQMNWCDLCTAPWPHIRFKFQLYEISTRSSSHIFRPGRR